MHDRGASSDMGCIAVSEHQAIEAVDAARTEIAAQNALKSPLAARVEKPVGSCTPHMDGRALPEIQRGDFGVSAIGPARPLDIQVAGGARANN